MSFLSRSVHILFALLLTGCATKSMLEVDRINTAEKQMVNDTNACLAQVDSNPKYAAIVDKLPPRDGNQSTPFRVLANSDKPTQHEKALLLEYIDDSEPCRKLVMERVGKIHPTYVVIFAESFQRADELTIDLLAGKLTWGEFARDFTDERRRSQKEYLRVVEDLNSDLRQTHEYEVRQRQAASQALASWAAYQQQIQAQQQIANSLNAPRTTTCRYVGQAFVCNSF